jgi:hypothetical protein
MSSSQYNVFPIFAYIGSTVGSAAPRIIEEYDDGTYRVYRKPGAVPLRYATVHLEQMDTATMNLVRSFFEQVTAAGDPNGGRFIFTDFTVGKDVVTGTQQLAEPGALLAIFLDARIDFTCDDNCEWSLTNDISIKIVNN